MLKKILVGVGLAAVGFAIGHTINVISKSRERPIAIVQPGDIIQWESSGKFIVFPEKYSVSMSLKWVFLSLWKAVQQEFLLIKWF